MPTHCYRGVHEDGREFVVTFRSGGVVKKEQAVFHLYNYFQGSYPLQELSTGWHLFWRWLPWALLAVAVAVEALR